MKILVTGAAGFIGSNLVETLLDKGERVIGIDKDKSKKRKFEQNISHPNLRMIWSDIKNLDFFLNKKDVDIVYHLAAASDIQRSENDTTWDLQENVIGTHNVLEHMRKKDIKKIVFSSTSVVYGEHARRPTPEDYPDRKPISQYAASKIAAEAFIHAYCNMYGMRGWIFRFANVMGKYQHRGVVYDFVQKLKKDPNNLEILGDGNQLKSYIHVSDCLDAMFWVLEHDNNECVEVYNLATTDQVTVTELADVVCDEMGLKPKYHYTGGDRGWKGDMPKISLAIDKILSTGWKPKMDCETALRRTVRELK